MYRIDIVFTQHQVLETIMNIQMEPSDIFNDWFSDGKKSKLSVLYANLLQ